MCYNRPRGIFMAFCSYSTQLVVENKTTVDNMFISSYLPFAPNDCVKVYLYGLMMCGSSNPTHNTIDEFSKALNLTKEDIESAYLYWQDQGLVQILETMPIQVRYLPIKNASVKLSKLSSDKYHSFNLQAQEIITGRMIMPNEYYEYYVTMESLHIEQSAFLMIIKYCVDLKGENVTYPYILTVAKNWANDGYTTAEKINEKLLDYEKTNEQLSLILKAMQIKRKLDPAERDLYAKWQNMGYDTGTIIFVVKNQKKQKQSVNFAYIDTLLEKYFSMKLFTSLEIDEYEEQKKQLFALSRTICKNLGLYYENIEPVVENYVVNWKNLGYDDSVLQVISNYCFKSSIRTLEYMNIQIQKFYKLGIVSEQSLNEYFNNIISKDEQIKKIIESVGQTRNVNNFDRECYQIWTENWNMPSELINLASEYANGRPNPIKYINKILSSWHSENITTIEQAKKSQNSTKEKEKSPKVEQKQDYSQRSYTKDEITSLFTSLEEIDI